MLKNFKEPLFDEEFIADVTGSQTIDVQCFPRLTLWLFNAFVSDVSRIAMAPHVLYTLVEEFMLTQDNAIFDITYKYIKMFPNGILDSAIITSLLLECGITAPLIFSNMVSLFLPEKFDNKNMEITLTKMYLIALLKCETTPSPMFIQNLCKIMKTKNNLWIKEFCEKFLVDAELEQIEKFVTLFPFHVSHDVFGTICINFIKSISGKIKNAVKLRCDFTTFDECIKETTLIENIKDAINTGIEENVKIVSTIVVILQYLAISYSSRIIDENRNYKNVLADQLDELAKELDFIWHGNDKNIQFSIYKEKFKLSINIIKKINEVLCS